MALLMRKALVSSSVSIIFSFISSSNLGCWSGKVCRFIVRFLFNPSNSSEPDRYLLLSGICSAILSKECSIDVN